MPLDLKYLETLKERGKKNRITHDYQLLGLELADILEDRTHKALYMKLAKLHPARELMAVAKRIAENRNIKNRGAYFMKVFFEEHKTPKKPKQTTRTLFPRATKKPKI